MLERQGIIKKENLKLIQKYLEKAKQEFLNNEFNFDEALEDVHINIENYVRKNGGAKTVFSIPQEAGTIRLLQIRECFAGTKLII